MGIEENNSITGTWVSIDYGEVIVGDLTHFRGTVTATGQTFNATTTAVGFGVSAIPGSVSAGRFTFNGNLDSFLGWSAGVSANAVAEVGYSMSSDYHSLVLYGAGTNLSVSATVGYTTLDPVGRNLGGLTPSACLDKTSSSLRAAKSCFARIRTAI